MKNLKILSLLIFSLIILSCNREDNSSINPTVEGNKLMCPNSFITLSTQNYDTYQWKKRKYNITTAENILGETQKTLKINTYDYTLNYVSVEVTKNGKKYISPEVLVDSYAFLPIHVKATGDFTVNPINGNYILVNGKSITFTLGIPINKNVSWYKNDVLISGETKDFLTVTQPGIYKVKASPELCPNYSETSIPLVVQK